MLVTVGVFRVLVNKGFLGGQDGHHHLMQSFVGAESDSLNTQLVSQNPDRLTGLILVTAFSFLLRHILNLWE